MTSRDGNEQDETQPLPLERESVRCGGCPRPADLSHSPFVLRTSLAPAASPRRST